MIALKFDKGLLSRSMNQNNQKEKEKENEKEKEIAQSEGDIQKEAISEWKHLLGETYVYCTN